MIEPIHNLGPRTTATAKAEGRSKIDMATMVRKKRKILKKRLFEYTKNNSDK